MILILLAGLLSLVLFAHVLMRSRYAAERERRAALETVRSSAAHAVEAPSTGGAAALYARSRETLARVHRRLWKRESARDIDAKLSRAGFSNRLTAEAFMAGRVALTALAILAGIAIGHGVGRFVVALVFAFAAVYLPSFFVSKAAARRTRRIDADLPHFVDQLAIAVEAGMTFDAGLSHMLDASDGPLVDELRLVLTELRVGESRKAALRGFADRVGSENAAGFANAVLTSDQLGSPLAGILRAQAADLRHKRQTQAEERAQKAPVKMLFPMVIFILPVIFVVILAPAFIGSRGIF